jgi:hypothetical protein
MVVSLLAASKLSAATHYVSLRSTNPTPPYTNWATAAYVIQDAVDAALPGDEIMVTNGVYATGGRAVGTNQLANRVAVDKPVTLRSVNGPTNTIIQGYQVPGTTNGDAAIRCVYLGDSAALVGFTLTNGATRTNGDWGLGQAGGGGLWCESTNALVSDCLLVGNSAVYGGGALLSGDPWTGCTLFNCTLSGNSALYGGGAYGGTLDNCILSYNSAADIGGGACDSTLNNCTLSGNSAYYCGGGAQYGRLNNCTLTGNWALQGGGAGDGWLNNCTITGNSAYYGGGAAAHLGFGDAWCEMNNCIVYFNTAPRGPNYGDDYTALNYCCTTPLPAAGIGNIDLDPQLASASHLSASSPCRGAGSVAYATGTDIDGEAWANPPCIGCEEYHAGAVTGPLTASIAATFTNVAVGYSVGLRALIEGRLSASAWDFGDGRTLTNEPCTSHAWIGPGDYAVVLRAYNETQPQGVSATITVHVVAQPVHYVAAGSANPVPPYTNWASAAVSIQDAVDVARVPGALVLVTNGLYAAGGRAVGTSLLVNRVVVDRPLAVRSVNGPQITFIQGYQIPDTTNGDGAIRCVYLADGAILSGFTLTNGATRSDGDQAAEQSGGGVCCEWSAVASNCLIVGNSAAYDGGGAYRGTLNNCTLASNSAWLFGGGASDGTLYDCTLTGNSAAYGGGGGVDWCILYNCTLTGNSAAYDGGGADESTLTNCTLALNSANTGGGVCRSTLHNCIVYFNTAPDGANYENYEGSWCSTLNYCCTTPLPTNGVSNIASDPLLVDYSHGNLRLQSNSPCINAGNNAYVTAATDLDSNPRIVSGTVDIGAYEFQGHGSIISYAWLQYYGLPTDGSADDADPDHDGMNNWQEWVCGTDPTNALSALRLLSASPTAAGVTVTWQGVPGVSYLLERSTNLAAEPPFSLLATDLPGQPGTTSFTDTNVGSLTPVFYRVGVTAQ